MTLTAAILTALLSAGGAGDGGAWAMAGVQFAQVPMGFRQRMTIRVPLPPLGAGLPPPARPRWREKKGPKCIGLGDIAGATVAAPDSVDMIFKGGTRLRAELENACPALDYYRGFYLRPAADGRVCADRDAVHARSGGECRIERFRRLLPPKRK